MDTTDKPDTAPLIISRPASPLTASSNSSSPSTVALHVSALLHSLRQCYQETMTSVHMEMTGMSTQNPSKHNTYIIRALQHLQKCYHGATATVNNQLVAMLNEVSIFYRSMAEDNVRLKGHANALQSENKKLKGLLHLLLQRHKQLQSSSRETLAGITPTHASQLECDAAEHFGDRAIENSVRTLEPSTPGSSPLIATIPQNQNQDDQDDIKLEKCGSSSIISSSSTSTSDSESANSGVKRRIDNAELSSSNKRRKKSISQDKAVQSIANVHQDKSIQTVDPASEPPTLFDSDAAEKLNDLCEDRQTIHDKTALQLQAPLFTFKPGHTQLLIITDPRRYKLCPGKTSSVWLAANVPEYEQLGLADVPDASQNGMIERNVFAGVLLARKLGCQTFEFFEPLTFLGTIIGDRSFCDVSFWRRFIRDKGIVVIGPEGQFAKDWEIPWENFPEVTDTMIRTLRDKPSVIEKGLKNLGKKLCPIVLDPPANANTLASLDQYITEHFEEKGSLFFKWYESLDKKTEKPRSLHLKTPSQKKKSQGQRLQVTDSEQ